MNKMTMNANMQYNPISKENIQAIIGMDSEPILRNLKITLAYYDLSQAIANRLGDDNVNWCNFATWASKTAGKFIRMEDINVQLHKSLHAKDDYQEWLTLIQEKFRDLEIDHEINHDKIHDAAHNVIEQISADIAAGNLKVFSELGPVFSAMIEAFDKEAAGELGATEKVLATLIPGTTETGGQDMLGNAIKDYHLALHETDQKRKAELILRANAQTGLHEQIRLQPFIAAAMEAPLHNNFTLVMHQQVKENAAAHKHHLLHGAFNHLFQPIAKLVQNTWLNLSTHYLMTLALPDGILFLGKDLPSPIGRPLFPEHLVNPSDLKLTALLEKYEAHVKSLIPSHARNWSILSDRMHFILNLFRSRQQHRPLYDIPFESHQVVHIRKNMMPIGKL